MLKTFVHISLFIMFAAGVHSLGSPEFNLSYRYQNAESKKLISGDGKVSLTMQTDTNDSRIEKAIFIADLGDLISETLTRFAEQCDEQPSPFDPFDPILLSTTVMPIMPPPLEPNCEEAKVALSNRLLEDIHYYSAEAARINSVARDPSIAETFDLLRKLAANMRVFSGYFGRLEFGRSMNLASPGLGVSTGGAQDAGYFKTTINNDGVPQPDSFDKKGFMTEFTIPLGTDVCDDLLCIAPVYKYDSENNRLFVAMAMNSNVTENTFVRRPLNLSLVIDVSGSMQANDGTEKSRLEWAKDAAINTINELENEDYVSVVIFDSVSEVLIPTTRVTSTDDKNHIIDAISRLETKNSTNLYDGLKAGYELVSDNTHQLTNYNHRVILISDAGLNTGNVDDAVNVRLVSDYAAENIGLTAIGLGLNFNQNFIEGISRSMGGNYIYAHSGEDMVRYFSSFKLLVSPIAHQLKVRLDFANTSATLLNAYGIPGEAVTSSNELINIQSLFLTNQGGGAVLLEYQLN